METPVTHFSLKTPRLRLREITADDVDDLMGIFGNARAMQFYPGTQTRKETLDWIDWVRGCYAVHGYGFWAAELRETSELIGHAGLVHQADVDGEDEVEIGYALLPGQWGRGFATEAAVAVRDYAVHQLGQRRLIALIDPANFPSIRVAEKLGMTYERMTRRWERELCLYSVFC